LLGINENWYEKYGYIEPKAILDAGWDEVVRCLDKGGYARYDFILKHVERIGKT